MASRQFFRGWPAKGQKAGLNDFGQVDSEADGAEGKLCRGTRCLDAGRGHAGGGGGVIDMCRGVRSNLRNGAVRFRVLGSLAESARIDPLGLVVLVIRTTDSNLNDSCAAQGSESLVCSARERYDEKYGSPDAILKNK